MQKLPSWDTIQDTCNIYNSRKLEKPKFLPPGKFVKKTLLFMQKSILKQWKSVNHNYDNVYKLLKHNLSKKQVSEDGTHQNYHIYKSQKQAKLKIYCLGISTWVRKLFL